MTGRWAAVGLALSLLFFGIPVVAAMDESDVKAAILYNLLQFVERHDSSTSAFVLCLRPGSELLAPMQKLLGQPVRGASLELRTLGPGESRACQAVYADGTDAERMGLLRKVRGDATPFVIADLTMVMDEGTAIQLRAVDNKIAFDVNMIAVKRSGAQVSSRILRLAKVVRE